MVTKLGNKEISPQKSLNLAKIHMVTKQIDNTDTVGNCLNLAKIHMVTKPIKKIYIIII